MVDFEKLLKKSRKLPWRPIFWLLSGSFFVATLAANLVSIVVMPDLTVVQHPTDDGGAGEQQLVVIKPTLSEADLKFIYDRNIFNKEGQLGDIDSSAEEDPTAAAKKTDLPLKLLGIIYGGTPFNGLATIENTQNSKINSFVVGDALVREATVAEIHRNRVYILRQGGRREFLELEVKEIIRSSRQKRKAPEGTPSGNTPIATGPALKNFKEEGFERSGNDMVMSQDYKQRILTQDFTKVLQDAKAVPNMVDNQIKGFRLERIREGSIYQKAGFQNGDVVEEINGMLLNDVGGAIKTLRASQNEAEIEVMVNRNGSTFPLKLSVK